MSMNILQKATRADVRWTPYPHVIIKDALPPDLYQALDDSFPEEFLNGSSPSVVDDRGHTRRYLSDLVLSENLVSPNWMAFFAYHISRDFYRYVTNEILDEAIQAYYPEQAAAIQRTPPVPRKVVAQAHPQTPIIADCQFVMNNPLGAEQTSRTPHLDNPVEIYAALFYMKRRDDRSDGGGLQLYQARQSGTPRLQCKREAVAEDVALHTTCPYGPNTVVLFLNCRHAIHGVAAMSEQHTVRRSINIIGEYGDGRRLFKL